MTLLKPTLLLLFLSASVYAQKLPNVQQGGLSAPANVKIDGKAAEWGPHLQAYNKAVDLSYSLANDAKNLYLIVQTDKPRIVEKIIGVGVTLTINKNGAKDYKNKTNAELTYPLLDVSTGIRILAAAGIQSDNVMFYSRIKESPISNLVVNENQTDSLIDVANKTLKTASKMFKIKGFNGLPDTLSIYNEHDIITAIDYNKNGTYTYELQIPLKLLGIAGQKNPFSYSIKLRNRLVNKKQGIMTITYEDEDGNTINLNQDLDADTDFWGDYTLAK
ncbi:MAG: hypothetical protein EOP47_06615 [Sphingobacteriaceae bacterium]|nr:MAG: hypothetical protein EOP47_06615 [Sphingobacteriaceae bacterium]